MRTIDRKKIDYFLSGGLWLSLPRVFTAFSGVAATLVLASGLSENDFGIYRYLLNIVAIISVFSLSGFHNAILQTSAKNNDSFYLYATRKNFTYSTFIFAVSAALSLYYFLNQNNILAAGSLLIALLLPIQNSTQFATSFLNGKKDFIRVSKILSFKTCITTAAVVTTTYITKEPLSIFLAYLISQTLINLGLHFQVKKEIAKKEPEKDFDKKYSKYGHHLSAQNIIKTVGHKLDGIIIFSQLGSKELALYAISTLFPDFLKGFLKSVSTLLLVSHSKVNPVYSKQYVYKNIGIVFFSVGILSLLYIVTIPHIVHFLIPKYIDSILFSQIYVLSLPAVAASLIPQNVLHMQHKNRALYFLSFVSSLTAGIMFVCLIPVYGVLAAVASKVAVRYLTFLFSIIVVFKIFKNETSEK